MADDIDEPTGDETPTDRATSGTAASEGAAPAAAGDEAATEPESDPALDMYDLDHDGSVSVVEDVRARLGLLDAKLEQVAEEDEGLKAKLAEKAHHLIDKIDNDES